MNETKTSDDLIRRRDAIEAVTLFSGYDAITAIRAIPPAQPVLTCDGCRHSGTYDTDFPCSGCVRREKDYYEPEEG